jgi:hypothetical protein
MEVKTKNILRSVTFDRFLYSVLEQEAEELGTKISHVINAELSKVFKDKIRLAKIQEASKYD